MGGKTALIIGATGLVGKELTDKILSTDDYSQINILTRRATDYEDTRIKEIIVDFDNMVSVADQLGADDVYCCIGTTIKKAGSKEKFVKIDYDYPLEIARLTQASGQMKKYLIVTAIGANPESSIFYNEVKGKLEEDLKKLDLDSLHIFRPSLLLGDRKEFRFWESVAKVLSAVLSFFLIGSEKKIWAIEGRQVAAAD
ncbi:MAG: NAD-dependent epimerase/dehydratase family protein, partial [Bacteroidota bacterium]